MTAILANPDAERAVLGAMLMADAADLLAVRQLLPDPAMFAVQAHRLLYRAVLAICARGDRPDHIALPHELGDDLKAAGGTGYLAELVDAVSGAERVTTHARIVRDLALRRMLAQEAKATELAAHDLTVPLERATNRLVDRLVQSAMPDEPETVNAGREFVGILDDIEARAKLPKDRDHPALLGVPSGLSRLDQYTDGWVNGRLIVIAARPKVGKTSFGLHCAERAASGGLPTYFVTGEQPRRELQKRRLAREAQCDLRAINTPQILDMQARDLQRAAALLAQRPLTIDQTHLSPATIRLAVQRHQAEHGKLGLLIVDYLGKLRSDRQGQRHDIELGYITSDLARLAIDLDLPVILLCQLNRSSVKDGTMRRPVITDLRDSGYIEQDASQLLFLWRGATWESPTEEWPEERVEIDLALNRFGPTGSVDAAFRRTTGEWHPMIRDRRFPGSTGAPMRDRRSA